jgi:hypothetical protein
MRKGELPMTRVRLDLYPDEAMRDALDRWRFQQPGVPNRAAAARQLLGEILVQKGFRPIRKRKVGIE